jgi:hypothetical protein
MARGESGAAWRSAGREKTVTPERSAQIRSAYRVFCNSPREGRAALLARLAGSDAQLHAELEALLKSEESGASALDSPASGSSFSLRAPADAQEGVQRDGVMEANVLSRGPVRIGPKATWKSDCRAASLHVELGAAIVSGYFVVPCEADAAD